MPSEESERRKRRDEDEAYARLDASHPDLGLDNISQLRSVERLSNNLVDLGGLIAQRLRERVAKRRAKGG